MENWIHENGKLGGAGLTVEVDESHVWTNKYARGWLTANQRCHFWLFGARCKETTGLSGTYNDKRFRYL